MKRFVGGGLAALALMALAGAAEAQTQAQALKVFAGGAVTALSRGVGVQFTRETGKPVEVTSGTTGALSDRLKAGEKADVVVVSHDGVEALIKAGLVRADSIADLARVGSAVAVKKGAKAPDVSSVAALKAALLAAKSVSYVDPKAGGTSGAHFETVLAQLGIAEAMKPKVVYRRQGSEVAAAVASGEAELGVTFISELTPNPGVAIAGLMPEAVQNVTVYSAGVIASAADPAGAAAFIKDLKSPAGAAVIRQAALEPLAK